MRPRIAAVVLGLAALGLILGLLLDQIGFSVSPAVRVYEELAPERGAGPTAVPTGPVATAVNWVVPQGWEPIPPPPPSGMIRIDWLGNFTAADQQVTIGVSRMRGQGGGPVMNLNRWRRQVGLPGIDPAAAESAFTRVATPAGPVDWVLLEHEGRGMLAGLLWLEGSTVAIKVDGPAGLVAGQQEAFRTFLRSLATVEPREPVEVHE